MFTCSLIVNVLAVWSFSILDLVQISVDTANNTHIQWTCDAFWSLDSSNHSFSVCMRIPVNQTFKSVKPFFLLKIIELFYHTLNAVFIFFKEMLSNNKKNILFLAVLFIQWFNFYLESKNFCCYFIELIEIVWEKKYWSKKLNFNSFVNFVFFYLYSGKN